MKKQEMIAALSALAQETRLDIYRHLIQVGRQGLPAGDIAKYFQLPAATLSFHLKTLKQAGLVTYRRENRSLIYTACYDTMHALLAYLTNNCCAGETNVSDVPICRDSAVYLQQTVLQSAGESFMNEKTHYNVLFLCTGNSARSIMAESLLNHWGAKQFYGYSAGSYPKGEIHPKAVQLLTHLNMPTTGLRSKSWDEFAQPEAPVMDFIFTVCDNAAAETCPTWPGQPVSAHWGVADPAAVEGDDAQQMRAFRQALNELQNRIKIFVSLPIAALDHLKLKQAVTAIGLSKESEGEI